MVSLNTSPHPGFSRNRSTRPDSSVMTMPNSKGLGTRATVTVTAAPVDSWNLTISVRSTSVRVSPESTRVRSSRSGAAFLTLPAVPSGSSSVA